MDSIPSPNRREILVDKAMQVGLVGKVVLVQFLTFSFFAAAGLMIPNLSSTFGIKTTLSPTQMFVVSSLVPLICSLLCAAGFMIAQMFKVAGPVYRMKQTFRALARLEIPSQFRYRKSDYFQESLEELEQAISAIHERFVQIENRTNRALALAIQESHQASPELKEVLQETVELFVQMELGENPETPAEPLVVDLSPGREDALVTS